MAHLLCSDALQNSASTSGSRPAEEEEEEKLSEAMHIKRLLHQNTEEMASILRALNGEYIEPQAGGDLLRDGAGVLPTGGLTGSSPCTRHKEQKNKTHMGDLQNQTRTCFSADFLIEVLQQVLIMLCTECKSFGSPSRLLQYKK